MRGRTDQNVIALTFDAGSDRGFAEEILDILAERDIRISFGLTGAWADKNPDLVARIAQEGHHIVNHSYSHPHFTQLSNEEIESELERAEAAIVQAGGGETRPWFRAPYGDFNAEVSRQLAAHGFLWNLGWTVDSLGWNGLSAAEITQRCLDRAEPGAIYLFHVGAQSEDAAALVDIIDGLEAMGYEMGSALDVL